MVDITPIEAKAKTAALAEVNKAQSWLTRNWATFIYGIPVGYALHWLVSKL